MQKRKVLILSILNLIAIFFPFGLIRMEHNIFLWKNNNSLSRFINHDFSIIDGVNIVIQIALTLIAFILMILAVVYFSSEKEIIKEFIKGMSIAYVCTAFLFCYHVYDYYDYKFINIGAILSVALCMCILISIETFDKKIFWILGVAIILTFPSYFIIDRIDIEDSVEPFYHSVQTHIYLVYDELSFDDMSWLVLVPSVMVIFCAIKMLAYVLCNHKKKRKAVWVLFAWIILEIALELYNAFQVKDNIYLTPTYPIAITLLSIYLYLEKKEKQ